MDDPQIHQWSPTPVEHYTDQPIEEVAADVRRLLGVGVRDRLTRDPNVGLACLVSGGVDSSSVLALAVQEGLQPECYTAVYDPLSTDLKHARELCSDFGLKLHEVTIPAPTPARLSAAVAAIEMPHKAQVEIALACVELAQAVASDGHKIVLSGEGSDELWASYGLSYHGVKREGWHQWRWKTYLGQHRKNFARTNKVFMRYGIEPRLPFLSVPLARYALTIDEKTVRWSRPGSNGTHEKAILAHAVDGLLPHNFAWQRKAAFQTKAGLDQAAAAAVAEPARYYRAEFDRLFQGVKP
jgi:asparagine synthase (glutamine-hydrolysing)